MGSGNTRDGLPWSPFGFQVQFPGTVCESNEFQAEDGQTTRRKTAQADHQAAQSG
jgi:hypothetical protein